MKIKILITLTIIIIFFIMLTKNVYAISESDQSRVNAVISEGLKSLDTNKIDEQIEKDFDISFKEMVSNLVMGKYGYSPTEIINAIVHNVFNDLYKNFELIRNLILIGLLSGLLTNLSTSFKKTEASKLAFYICFIATVTILYNSFFIAYSIAQSLIDSIYNLIIASMPLIYGTIVLSGNPTFLATFNPLVFFFADTVIIIMENGVLPFVMALASLEIINNITSRDILTTFSKTAKQLLGWLLKSICVLFMTILTLQRITAPILDGVVSKTAKLSVSAVPVVGQVLSQAVDTALYLGSSLKSGAMAALIIVVLLYCGSFVVKLVSFVLVYKIAAIAIEPIGDKRIINAINATGDYVGYLIAVCGVVTFMFLFMVIMVVSL